MKQIFYSISLMLLAYNFSFAQTAPYNVVFDVTSKDTLVHQMVIRWINEITSSRPDAKIEVVYYAKGLDMITAGKSVVSTDVQKYAAMKNVAFRVCEVAMKNNGIERSQLLPGVQTVPDGIYEIIQKQHDGWGYIKAAR